MEKYKSLAAYKFYIDGWVQGIKHIKVNEILLFTAEVRPSYKTTDEKHSVWVVMKKNGSVVYGCLLYTSPSPRDKRQSRMPSSA